MHYRHAYHAGNFADVVKHTVLAALLEGLSRKDKPWCYLETHAGAGLYDLGGREAQATREAEGGILRLQAAQASQGQGEAGTAEPVPAAVARLLAAVAEQNPASGPWRRYPGSPLVAHAHKRPGDRLVLCEQVPDVVEALRFVMPGAQVHARDGYGAHALLPPAEKRGLVLVDAAFERRDEFAAMEGFFVAAQSRFAGGVFAFWYPIKNRHEAERFRRRLAAASTKPVLDAVYESGARAEQQMVGCGVAVVNPPFGVEADIAAALDWLAPRLAEGSRAEASVTWLKTERECATAPAGDTRARGGGSGFVRRS